MICLFLLAPALLASSAGEMPLSFYGAMNNGGSRELLSTQNYETGASMTEAYTDFEKLNRNTEVVTRSYASDQSCAGCGSGGLEASINSQVIGNAHIAWQSVDPATDNKGRHQLLGRSVEDLTGIFSIEKFIQLWSASRPGEISVDWLPCT